MTEKEKVVQKLEEVIADAVYPVRPLKFMMSLELAEDALALLKAQEQATIEPKRIDLADETKAWLDKMDAVDALGNIADICMDWDGYRTADGLGGLINEIWAYAWYYADRLRKAQEPRVMTLEEIPDAIFGWMEMFGQLIPCVLEDVYVDDTVGFANIEDGHDYISASDYGKTWRCWTSRPTDEQREKVKWDAQEQRDYEAAVEMAEYCERYEPTYNADDGSM